MSSPSRRPPDEDGGSGMSAAACQANFLRMAAAFAVNHGVSTTPLVLASSVLGKDVGDTGNTIFFVAAIASTLLVASPATGRLGPRGAMALGFALYSLYVGGFGLTAATSAGKPGAFQAGCWVLASLCGGLAGGVLWTAQGAYFSASATLLAAANGGAEPREALTSRLAGTFSFLYLAMEVISRLVFSALHSMRWPPGIIAGLFFLLAVASTLTTASLHPFEATSPQVSVGNKVRGVAALWGDPNIWLLSPTNLAFGFSAALMNGHVNATYGKALFGDSGVAALAALTSVSAAIASAMLGYFGGKVGKAPLLTLGSFCFFSIGFAMLVLDCCQHWGRWAIALYLFQGVGRAVYESTNRAAFADFFHGRRADAAFANCALQSNLAFATSFALQTRLTEARLSMIVTCLAAAVPLSYAAAAFQREDGYKIKHGDDDSDAPP